MQAGSISIPETFTGKIKESITIDTIFRQWIAAQGPLENTVNDFWKCVWETDVTSIIMLCKVVECMQDKCAQYWPSELFIAEEYDSLDVIMEEEEFLDYAVKRVFVLCHNSGKSRKGKKNILVLLC